MKNMMIAYHDVGGAHSTAIEANVHINKLPVNRIPSKQEILNLPTFDKGNNGLTKQSSTGIQTHVHEFAENTKLAENGEDRHNHNNVPLYKLQASLNLLYFNFAS